MKKLLALALALVLALSLAACGGNTDTPSGTNGNTSTPNNSQNGDDTTPGGNNNADITTVKGFLAYWGLSEDDLKCANFTRLDQTVTSTETGEIREVSAYVSQKLTEDEIRAWLEQVMTKLNALSDDGRVERFLGDGEALTADYMMEQTMYIGQGEYKYNGKTVEVMISVPNSLDNDDPNDAMACCSLKLEWD